MNNWAEPTTAVPVAHEDYAFVCLRCGTGWEDSFEITHEASGDGPVHAVYHRDGRVVPSPISRPGCVRCGAPQVRILRAGEVAAASAPGNVPALPGRLRRLLAHRRIH